MRKVAALTACTMVVGGSALAGGTWYGGAEAGYTILKFEPQYTFMSERPDRHFTNRGYGAEVGAFGGYRFQLGERCDLGIQARFSGNNARWELNTDEPAHLEYEMPYGYGLSLVPAVKLCSRASLFGELGIGQVWVMEEKDGLADDVSRYKYEDWETGYIAGIGLRVAVNDRVSILALFRYAAYEDFSYRSKLPDGTPVEHIEDEIKSESFNVALSCDL
jgi:opacity protein-like surface antigen